MGAFTASRSRPIDDSLRDPSVWTATGREVPVFFDRHGRRRHWVAGVSALSAILAASWLLGLIGGAFGFASLPPPTATTPTPAHAHPLYASDAVRRAHHFPAAARGAGSRQTL